MAAAIENAPEIKNVQAPAEQSKPLAQSTAEEQAEALKGGLKLPDRDVIAAVLSLKSVKGNIAIALSKLDSSLHPQVAAIARLIPILGSPLPKGCVIDGRTYGLRIGDVYAKPFGLQNLYSAAVKDAVNKVRDHLGDDFRW